MAGFLTIMQPTPDAISKAKYGAAYHDLFMGIPDGLALEQIKRQGLERLIPDWMRQQRKEEAGLEALTPLGRILEGYPTPQQFLDYIRMEEQQGSLPQMREKIHV